MTMINTPFRSSSFVPINPDLCNTYFKPVCANPHTFPRVNVALSDKISSTMVNNWLEFWFNSPFIQFAYASTCMKTQSYFVSRSPRN